MSSVLKIKSPRAALGMYSGLEFGEWLAHVTSFQSGLLKGSARRASGIG